MLVTTRLSLPLAAGLLLGTAAAAQDAAFGPLVSAASLQPALDRVEVIDIRADGEDGYDGGHLAGAVSAPYGLFRGPDDNPGQIPTEKELTEVLGGLGLVPSDRVVIAYQGEDATDFGAAARVYWTLKSSGFDDISILNGGINAWTEAGFDLSTDPVEVAPSDINVTWNDRWTASAEDVQEALAQGDTLLLDARPESFWNGDEAHPAAARPGTIPQSEYFEHSGWFSDGPAIVEAEAAIALAGTQDFTGAEQIISFCNTGHWAATNWFALSELAGIDNVKLYPESVVGWSNAGYDMANVPGPVRTLWNQVKSVF